MNEPSNQQQGSWSNQQRPPAGGPVPPGANQGGAPRPMIGAGEGEVPLAKPPAQSMNVRTMASDVASLQQTGGTQPRPYTPPPAGGPTNVSAGKPAPAQTSFTGAPAAAPRPYNVPPAPAVPPPSFSAPLTPPRPSVATGGGGPRPPAGGHPAPAPQPPARPGAAPAKSSKALVVGAVIVAVVVGLGALGYFVVYPLIAEPSTDGFLVTSPEPPAPAAPAEPQAPAAPPIEPTSAPTSSEPVSGELPVPAHASLFAAPADLTEETSLAEATEREFRAKIPFDTAEVSILREIALSLPSRNAGGTPAPATLEQFISFAVPGVFDRDAIRSFGNDVTVFTYTDAKGTWPGFAVRATDGTALAALALKVGQRIEQQGALSPLFLTDPGTPGTWKSGSTGNVGNRYQTFSLSGAALNYGWSDRTLIVATSYDAFRTALGRMR